MNFRTQNILKLFRIIIAAKLGRIFSVMFILADLGHADPKSALRFDKSGSAAFFLP